MTPMHFVSTYEEAERLVDGAGLFAISNCGCREARGACGRSKHETCLMFVEREPSGSGKRAIARDEVDALLAYARERALVARPFRDDATRTKVEGICFCCDDCCSYFRDRSEVCDRGARLEHTELDACNGCAACVDVCRFDARAMRDGGLVVEREACYGCGLCVDVCPTGCVTMVAR